MFNRADSTGSNETPNKTNKRYTIDIIDDDSEHITPAKKIKPNETQIVCCFDSIIYAVWYIQVGNNIYNTNIIPCIVYVILQNEDKPNSNTDTQSQKPPSHISMYITPSALHGQYSAY